MRHARRRPPGGLRAGVTIYADVIRRYGSLETLFYLDLPYWNCEADYGEGVFASTDFERLVDQPAAIAGQFVLSINATPGAHEVFARFRVDDVETTYTAGTASGGGKRAGELIVRSE